MATLAAGRVARGQRSQYRPRGPGVTGTSEIAMVASPRLAASLRQSSSSQRRQLHKLAPSPAYPPEIANQTIAPYTDLLHGPRPHFQAAGQEWRTPPLWGLGISEAVNGYTSFRQDGRAQGVREASRWHGGEALGRRRELSATSRAALAAFSKSL